MRSSPHAGIDSDRASGLWNTGLGADLDVLDPGIVPTEYRVPGGLSLMDLERAAARLARNPLIGLEIAEFESEWVENGRPGEPDRIVSALWPLLGPLQAS
jgi:arginase